MHLLPQNNNMNIKSQLQQEALEIISQNKKCGIEMSMGLGKTYLGLLDLNRILHEKSRFLIVVPKLNLIENWKKEISLFKLDHLLKHIQFSTYRSLNKENLNYDKIILDECHSLTPTHSKWLKNYKGSILGLTGTAPKESDQIKFDLVEFYCPIKYRKNVTFAVNNKILNDYKIYVHMIPLSEVRNIKFGKGKFSEREIYNFFSRLIAQNIKNKNYKKLQELNILRMKYIQKFDSKIKYVKKLLDKTTSKTIVFVDTKQQADSVCEYTVHSSEGMSKINLENFKKGKINKISCVLQLSEGENIENLENAIITHAYANNRKTAQRIGRLLRLRVDKCANCHIMCYENTIDVEWVFKSLEDFDQNKIKCIK